MSREVYFEDLEERDKRENKIWLAICRYLIWIGLIGVSLFFASRALIAEGRGREPENAISEMDRLYFTELSDCKVEAREGILKNYYRQWQQQFREYLVKYEASCRYEGDKEMVQKYREAVEAAIESQRELMAAFGASSEDILWYGIETYRIAFFKDLQGIEEVDTSLTWCNELNRITMETYEKLAKEDKELLTKWQICREEWKEAGDYFGDEKIEDRLTVYSQINQLYYQQLVCILSQNDSAG